MKNTLRKDVPVKVRRLQVADESSERMRNAIDEALKLSLRWMVIEKCPGDPTRFGPFGTKDEAEFWASQKTAYGYEVVKMFDIRILEERVWKEHERGMERLEYLRAMKLTEPRNDDSK